ncbi:MAG: heme exporter protein CcmB [Anaerolineae bacterium]
MSDTARRILAHDLGHRYGRLRVLDGADAAFAPGERVALRGANGAGKTTPLRILAGLLRPQRGVVDRGEGPARIAFVGQAPRISRADGLRERRPVRPPARPARSRVGRRRRPGRLRPGRSAAPARPPALARPAAAVGPGAGVPGRPGRHPPRRALDGAGRRRRPAAGRCDPRRFGRGAAVVFAVHDDARAALADRTLTLAAGRLAEDRGPAADGSTGPGARSATALGPAERAMGGGAGERRPPGVARGAWLIARKDVLTELRAREVLPAMGVFAALCGVVLAYALGGAAADGAMADLARVAPGAFWVALLFGGTLGLGRMMAGEVDTDALSSLRLTPLDGGALFLGKWAAATAFTMGIAAALAPLWVALFALRPGAMLGLFAIALAGVPGWAAAGVLVAALSATARGREVLLPILLFPLLLPLVLAAVRATAVVLAGASAAALGPALAMLLAYDVIFCVVGFWLFPVVVDGT